MKVGRDEHTLTLYGGDSERPLARALAQWQDAAGPFWPYVCATPFLSDLAPSDAVQAERRLPRALAVALQPGAAKRTAIFVDQAPERTLAATPALTRLGYVVVPVIQRWATAPAVVPSETLLAQLVGFGELTTCPPNPRGLVFLLDRRRFGAGGRARVGDRVGAPRHPPRAVRRAFDNRYEYPVCRFPPPDLLGAFGVGTSRWVPTDVAPDMRPYFERLANAGLAPKSTVPSPNSGA